MASIPFILPVLFVTVLCSSSLSAVEDENTTRTSGQERWLAPTIDSFQEYWSRKVLIFSSNLDHMFSDGFEDNEKTLLEDTNLSTCPLTSSDSCFPKPKITSEYNRKTYETSSWFDDFFKDETYLDTTNKSYVKVRGGYEYDKRGDSGLFHRITARIKLPKTQDKLQLFIGDETEEKIDPSKVRDTGRNEGVGIKYFLPSIKNRLYTNASVGFSGIDNPYVKAHIEYPVFLGTWLFKATQNFKYSAENKFDEWTSLYFDRRLSSKEIIRLLLQRSTNSEIRGMEYLAQLSYMNTLTYGTGFNYYLAVNGRTKDLTGTTYHDGSMPQEGVYNYSAGVIWRQQLFKDYLFYQIEPILSYHEQYDYKPNYLLRLSFDLYFGNKR